MIDQATNDTDTAAAADTQTTADKAALSTLWETAGTETATQITEGADAASADATAAA